jgi:hypothetical protein
MRESRRILVVARAADGGERRVRGPPAAAASVVIILASVVRTAAIFLLSVLSRRGLFRCRLGWCICAVVEIVKRWRAKGPPGGAGARRPWGAVLVTLALADAALLLALLAHLDVAAVGVGILAAVPGSYLVWKAIPAPVTIPRRGRPPRKWDPVELGVHQVLGGGPMPAYVPRQHDELLAAVLDPAVQASRLVVIRGDSSTGKTRAAYQAVTSRVGAWHLDYPLSPSALAKRLDAGIPPETVLWLGELRQYADADGGADALGRLADLLNGKGVLVITTVWPEHWNTYTTAARPGPGPADPAGVAGRLLERLPDLTGTDPAQIDAARGGVIDVPPQFTSADVNAAARTGDPVLAAAATAAAEAGHAGQITQYLAGVPDLLDRYEGPGGNPYGQAIITAAMDASRLGHTSPLPAALLQDAAPGYLTGSQRTAPLANWWDAALAWAIKELRGAVRALEPVPPATGTGVAGYRVADYLDQHGRRTRQDQLGPPSLWDALTTHTTAIADLNRLARAAENRGLYRHAAAFCTAAAHRDTDAATQLIIYLLRINSADTTRAAHWAAHHTSTDDPKAVNGLLLEMHRAGATDAARTLAGRAATDTSLDLPGHVALLLKILLHEVGACDAARTLAGRAATDAGIDNPRAVHQLLQALHEIGESDAARTLAGRAAAHTGIDDPLAVHWLLDTLHEIGASDAARTLAGRAARPHWHRRPVGRALAAGHAARDRGKRRRPHPGRPCRHPRQP